MKLDDIKMLSLKLARTNLIFLSFQVFLIAYNNMDPFAIASELAGMYVNVVI